MNTQTAATTNNFIGTGNSSTINPLIGASGSSSDFPGGISQGYTQSVTVTGGFATATSLSISSNVPYAFVRVV